MFRPRGLERTGFPSGTKVLGWHLSENSVQLCLHSPPKEKHLCTGTSKAKQGLEKLKPQIEEMILKENLSTWPFKMRYKSQGVEKPWQIQPRNPC